MFKLLLVDDELTLLKMLSWRLESVGFTVNTAASAEEALEKYHQEQPDLIISDIRMPGKDGIYLITEIQSCDPLMPCVVMSGHSDFEVEEIAKKLVNCNFIRKPINFDKLVHLIKQKLVSTKLA